MAFSLLQRIKDSLYKINKFKNYLIYTLLNKKFNLKRILRKFQLIFKGIEIGDKKIPWIPIKAKIWLDNNLRSDMILFEYGSGLSTLYFSQKVNKIVSIEHDKEWYNKIHDELKDKIPNLEYFLIEPEHLETVFQKKVKKIYQSHLHQDLHFTKYVQSIDKYPDEHFDLIFVDGRARLGCILHSINKIKPGGYIILDNSDAKRYKAAQSILKNFTKIKFYGVAPTNPYLKYSKISFTQTSIWIKG
ncbi:MAG: hypothetical protein ACFFCV_15005 [Promethearchaeota archaeon]